jgi:acetate kinase
MGGVDVLIFAGGIGLNSPAVRSAICTDLEFMGIAFNEASNQALSGLEGVISSESSRVSVLVAKIDEELVIARDTFRLVRGATPSPRAQPGTY